MVLYCRVDLVGFLVCVWWLSEVGCWRADGLGDFELIVEIGWCFAGLTVWQV